MKKWLDSVFVAAMAAVAQAVEMWQRQARLKGQVHGINLIVTRGGLTGPPLAPLIRNHPAMQGVPSQTADKFAKVFGDAWQRWQDGFMVSGYPAYPAFAAWPGPTAPPTANVPFPVAAGVSAQTAALSASALRSELLAQFPGATPQQKEAINAFATAAAHNFNVWCASTQVRNVMGSGPVPTFAPPAVHVGAVVGGTATMPPGGLVGFFPATGIP